MRRLSSAIVLLSSALMVTVATLAAQGGRGGAPTNLQVLPKDWTRQQVQAMMQTFGPALGVMCDHCHVSTQDRASDAKPPKLVARKMIAMVAAINDTFLKDVGEAPEAGKQKVTCYTCHRGALKPLTTKPIDGGHPGLFHQ